MLALGAKSRRGGSGSSSEVSAESRSKEGSEDNFGTAKFQLEAVNLRDDLESLPEHWERQPQEENKLENKVEREPVDNVYEALSNSEEGEDDPVL